MKYRHLAILPCLLAAIAGTAIAYRVMENHKADAYAGLVRRGTQAGVEPAFYALLAVPAPEWCGDRASLFPAPGCRLSARALNALMNCGFSTRDGAAEMRWAGLMEDMLSGRTTAWDDARWEDLDTALAARQRFLDAGRTMANQVTGPRATRMLDNVMGQERLWQVRTEIQRTLVAEAIVRLHRNDWEGFTEYLSLQLAQAKNAEAFTLYHAKAVSADALLTAHAALRHGTRPGDLDRPRTERILAALPDFTTESDLPEALAMDAAANLHMAAQALRLGAFRHGSETRQATVLSIGQDDLGLRRYLAKATLTGYTERMNRAIDAARRPYHEVRTALAALAQPSWLDRVLPNETPRVPIGAFTARAHREALSHLIRQGLLVELYFGEHGAWPASLDDIAGDLGGNLPIDPFSGATYVYRPSDDGFQLYSVGENGGDDGGHTNSGQDDLVWRGSNDLRARD